MKQDPGKLLYAFIEMDIQCIKEKIENYTGENDEIVSILKEIKDGLEYSLKVYRKEIEQ